MNRPVVLALLLAMGGAACGGAPAPASPPAPEPVPSVATPRANADVEFLQHMIHHHAQALVMTALVPERTTRADIRLIADRIDVSQRDEIAQMQRMLRDRGETVPQVDTAPPATAATHAGHGGHSASAHASMPGMLTPDELARLAAARGPAFDRLFLQSMIRHHAGALTMVSDLLARGGAQQSAMYSLASEIESDQQMEIARMERLLAALPSGN